MSEFNFGKNLRKIRQSKDISQAEMALRLGIAQSTYRLDHQYCAPRKNGLGRSRIKETDHEKNMHFLHPGIINQKRGLAIQPYPHFLTKNN